MKNSLFTLLILLLSATVWSQSPEMMSYQAVIRDANNSLVTNSSIGMKISILQGSISGNSVYTETQNPTTNSNGLIAIEIGNGTTVFGDFSTIDWSNNSYFIKTETDPTGSINYSIEGITQLLSVPYALYSKTSGSSTPGPQGIQGPQGPQGIPGNNFFNNMQGGTTYVGTSQGQTILSVLVTFPVPFNSTPHVICTSSAEVGTGYDDSFNVTTRTVTNTSFIMIINRVDGSTWGQNMEVHWLAFE
ncbi:MAG: H-type lectin domain-containing protein [Flavobacteriales bacterium]|nr:H-type lectin domain-containing protein [Flavobacteriales bacterium]